MAHKPHEIPLPRGPRNYEPPKPKPRASLAALQWAADRAGKSYGTFTLKLNPADEAAIQEEFEAYKKARNAEVAARRTQRVGNEVPLTGGFIIIDNDA